MIRQPSLKLLQHNTLRNKCELVVGNQTPHFIRHHQFLSFVASKAHADRLITRIQKKYGRVMAATISIDHSEEQESLIFSPDMMNPHSSIDIDDINSHLKIQLYPNDQDPLLQKIHEAASIQQIIDAIKQVPQSELSLKHSSQVILPFVHFTFRVTVLNHHCQATLFVTFISFLCLQALISLWDLQKFLYKLNIFFDPEKELLYKTNFVAEIRSHPTFICHVLNPIVNNVDKLEDEPLVASLLCLQRMNYDVKTTGWNFIQECLKRKNTLKLPALSRLCVCLRSESMFGSLVLIEFLPLAVSYLDSVDNDLDIRLLTITLRSSQRVLGEEIVNLFRRKIEIFLGSTEFETVTLCKILLFLTETKLIGGNDQLLLNLIRKLGTMLVDKVDSMEIMDLLTMQKFVDSAGQDPYLYHEGLLTQMARILEQGSPPRLDLLSTVAPFMKDFDQRKNMLDLVRRFLNSYSDFETVSHMLLKILRCARINDKELFRLFWSRYQTLIEADSAEVKRNIRGASDYITFMFSNGVYNRNRAFETANLKLLYGYMNNYLGNEQPTFISPQDFVKVISFLLAYSSPEDPFYTDIQYLSKLNDFASQFRVSDLFLLSRSVNLALLVMSNFGSERKRMKSHKCYDYLLQVCSILEEQSSFKVLDKMNPLRASDLLTVCRLSLNIQKVLTGECSPIFLESIKQAMEQTDCVDSKFIKDTCNCLIAGNFYYPLALDKIASFIHSSHEYMGPDVAERFINLAFAYGFEETADKKIGLVLAICAELIEKNMKRMAPLGILQSALALCFFRCLSPKLAQSIFSVEFLDFVDLELKAFTGNVSDLIIE